MADNSQAKSVSGTVTRFLRAWEAGDPEAFHSLMEYTYAELKKIAGHLLKEKPNRELTPTELVNQAFLSLVDRQEAIWVNRKHFYNCAGNIMRHAIIDHIRINQSQKRGGGKIKISFQNANLGNTHLKVEPETVMAIHNAMDDLKQIDPNLAILVNYRFFLGCSIRETAEIMGISEATVKRKWKHTKHWLFNRMKRDDEGDSPQEKP